MHFPNIVNKFLQVKLSLSHVFTRKWSGFFGLILIPDVLK